MKYALLASGLSLAMASTAAVAHPGSHHDLSIARGLLHAIGAPDHLGASLAVALTVVVFAFAARARANAVQRVRSMAKRKPESGSVK